MKIFIIWRVFAVFLVVEGLPRPTPDKNNKPRKRESVPYGYPEATSEPNYSTDQTEAFTDTPGFSGSNTYDLKSASDENYAADQNPLTDQGYSSNAQSENSQHTDSGTTQLPTENTQIQSDVSSLPQETTLSPSYEYASETTETTTDSSQALSQSPSVTSYETSSTEQTNSDASSEQTSSYDESASTEDQTTAQDSSTSNVYDDYYKNENFNQDIENSQQYNLDQDNPQGTTTSNIPNPYTTENNDSASVYLSSSATANILDTNRVDDNRKLTETNKEATLDGNYTTTYLELPKILHKPAVVKYLVQIAPKKKDVPIEQKIAIVPPDVNGVKREPLILLKQVISHPTEEHINVIVPKSNSDAPMKPKIEVKGGHIDQEVLNVEDTRDPDQDQGEVDVQTAVETDYDKDQHQGQNQDKLCHDEDACRYYNPNLCNKIWMKDNCKKMCGLCIAPDNLDKEMSLSSYLSDSTSRQKYCKYSGIVHQHGETWSPGPCVPKCLCNNGDIKCSKLECPDLNCGRPIKRRWKCCPECLPSSGNETSSVRCGVETNGGNGENFCCVFPFNYRGVDYFRCTTTDAEKPWCSVTRNYDRDGLWGNCVVKLSATSQNQDETNEKAASNLAPQLSRAENGETQQTIK
ncbi:uncharacterized protein LOC124444299 [Xenia sp. Carnegie-2017]|uniref:uncharacterized protein LOC124444299 n=1 Tax=Xenia sp. Carnegie-2017 TaxID=2897299 RepID=UPI001F04548A|nr:uncharacterized protein LOC124444299 [Xenia sp. Carnegie-2017]